MSLTFDGGLESALPAALCEPCCDHEASLLTHQLLVFAGEMLYMGSPAQPVFKSNGSEKAAGPKQETAKLMFQTWPFVQAAIAFGITTLATYITAVVALASVALYGSTLQVRPSALSSSLSLNADTPTITNVCTRTWSVIKI